MSYRFALGCSVLAALVLLGTACGQPSAPPPARPAPPTLSLSPPAAQQCNWRVSLRPHDPLPAPLDGITPLQLRELARYAARYHVTFIPEQQKTQDLSKALLD